MQPTILIVDDEKHTREGLRASLEDSFDVYVAASGAEARGVLEREEVDLVLTDLRLGGEDGMALIDEMLKRPKPPIVIMMTAYGSVDAAVEVIGKLAALGSAPIRKKADELFEQFIQRLKGEFRAAAEGPAA